MNSVKLSYKTDTIFMNSKSSKVCNPHILLHRLLFR